MNKLQLDEMLYCLSDERNTYTYFKDKYCMVLFQNFITQAISIQELKKSTYAQFCHKPKVKKWLSTCGSKTIEPEMLMALWQQELYHFTLSLGQWGGDSPRWQQTCRKGYNLVLQLNFTKSHDRFYEKVVNKEDSPFSYSCHPISSKRNTLAWSRLDFSEDFSEVLIEEIQTDWLREAKDAFDFLSKPKNENYYGIKANIDLFNKYYETLVKPLKAIWDEAILCATLEFLANDIGAKDVYFYDYDTGLKLKSLEQDFGPPKSLYTKLPKKFGFKTVTHAPTFISEDRYSNKKLRRIKSAKWHYINLQEKKYA